MGSNFQNYSKNIYCENKNGLTRFLCENFTYEIWGKLYRRDIIDEIRFPLDISIGEDVIFLLEIYKNIKNYCIVSSENKYYYNDENQNSLMSTQVKVNSDEIMIMGLLNRNQLHWSLAYFFISSYYWHLCLKNENILIAYWKSIPLSKLSYFSLPIKCVIKIIILCINGLYLSIKWKKIN